MIEELPSGKVPDGQAGRDSESEKNEPAGQPDGLGWENIPLEIRKKFCQLPEAPEEEFYDARSQDPDRPLHFGWGIAKGCVLLIMNRPVGAIVMTPDMCAQFLAQGRRTVVQAISSRPILIAKPGVKKPSPRVSGPSLLRENPHDPTGGFKLP